MNFNFLFYVYIRTIRIAIYSALFITDAKAITEKKLSS